MLIVEDLEIDAQLIRRELVRGGLDVEAQRVEREEDLRRALTHFAPHVILSDLSLPHLNGMAALSIARETTPDVPFIFVCGTLADEAALVALSEGAHDYVLKGNLLRLPALVRQAIRAAELRAAARRGDK